MATENSDVYTEGKAKAYSPKASGNQGQGPKDVFINPIQCYNRDLSVVAIRAWSEMLNADKASARAQKQVHNAQRQANKRKRKAEEMQLDDHSSGNAGEVQDTAKPENATPVESVANDISTISKPSGPVYRFSAFEALAASGLRSIRYALEIPLLKTVLANDLSKQAVENIRRNLTLNGLPESTGSEEADRARSKVDFPMLKVNVNEGDCLSVMYEHREKKKNFDVIDLDPYGTAAPFIDAAVQAVADGGLLCVTCTDLAVLAGTNYPEKCYSNYGGGTTKSEFSHEGALRLVLQTISTSAARYGKRIKPLLSFSIDYYLRVFVKVQISAQETKKAITDNGLVYICDFCQNHILQPFGRMNHKAGKKDNVSTTFRPAAAAQELSSHCKECGSTFHVAGPMWLGPIHHRPFVDKMLEIVQHPESDFHTGARLKGMLSIAQKELDTPFYFTPSKIASSFHSQCPSLSQVINALLHLGYEVSRSHAAAGSIKTNASRSVVHDVYMAFIDTNPVRLDKVVEKSPTRVLLARERVHKAINFSDHPRLAETMMTDVKLVRYQSNPEANWGPQSRAVSGHKKAKHE